MAGDGLVLLVIAVVVVVSSTGACICVWFSWLIVVSDFEIFFLNNLECTFCLNFISIYVLFSMRNGGHCSFEGHNVATIDAPTFSIWTFKIYRGFLNFT